MGVESNCEGIIDLIHRQALYFDEPNGWVRVNYSVISIKKYIWRVVDAFHVSKSVFFCKYNEMLFKKKNLPVTM